MVDRIPWEKGSKDKDSDNTVERRSVFRGVLGYTVSIITGAAIALGAYHFLSVKPRFNEAREENSRLTQIVEEKSAERDSLVKVVDSLTTDITGVTATIDSLNTVNRNLKVNYGKAIATSESLRGDLMFYMDKVDSLSNIVSKGDSALTQVRQDNSALYNTIVSDQRVIADLSLRLAAADSAFINYRRGEEASKPQVIKLPGGVSTRFNYYLKNGDNAGGLTLSKSLGQTNLIDTAIEGGFNVFDGRDTGQFLGFRLSLDLLERFSWDFGLGPYILKDFSDGAKATLTLYGESGFYFEPFGKVKGFGLRVGVRNIADRVDYSTAIEIGRN